MSTIDRGDPNPLYLQVSDFVRERIYSQEWGVNDRIPSEHELMAILGVSRGTIQKGIRALVAEGLLVQRQGRGTFVARPILRHSTGTNLLSFAESLRLQGLKYETRVLDMRQINANGLVAVRLGISEGDPTLLLRRVRSVAGEAVMLMESRLNLIACPNLERYDYSRRTLFSAVEESSQHSVSYGIARYGACVAGAGRATVLSCGESDPVMHIDQVIYLDGDVAAEWGNMWLPANHYVVSSVLKRL